MNKTFTPGLAPGALGRLDAYAGRFRDLFKRPRLAARCDVYLRGLIQDGDRESAEPIAGRIPLPPGLKVSDPDQALLQFLGQSPWDEQTVWRRSREVVAAEFAGADRPGAARPGPRRPTGPARSGGGSRGGRGWG